MLKNVKNPPQRRRKAHNYAVAFFCKGPNIAFFCKNTTPSGGPRRAEVTLGRKPPLSLQLLPGIEFDDGFVFFHLVYPATRFVYFRGNPVSFRKVSAEGLQSINEGG